jgi:hypothetical protein
MTRAPSGEHEGRLAISPGYMAHYLATSQPRALRIAQERGITRQTPTAPAC